MSYIGYFFFFNHKLFVNNFAMMFHFRYIPKICVPDSWSQSFSWLIWNYWVFRYVWPYLLLKYTCKRKKNSLLIPNKHSLLTYLETHNFSGPLMLSNFYMCLNYIMNILSLCTISQIVKTTIISSPNTLIKTNLLDHFL